MLVQKTLNLKVVCIMKQKSIIFILFFSLTVLAMFIVPQLTNLQLTENLQAASAPSCRYGVATTDSDHVPWVSTLNAGWFLNFSNSTATLPTNGAEFYHVVRVSQDKNANGNYLQTYTTRPALYSSEFDTLIANSPGSIWVIGNEADRGPNPGETEVDQDDTFPDVYATIYHDTYHYIKDRDPSALISNTSMVQVTPGRLQYLDIVWDTYLEKYGTPMPVDIWNFHVYILPETNEDGSIGGFASVALGTDPALGIKISGGDPNKCALADVYCFAEHDDMTVFDQQVRAMRQWMKDHGQQEKPLILTEYSILYPYEDDGGSCFLQDEYGQCFTPTRVNNFMNATFNYFENTKDPNLGYSLDDNRLVQQWLWFSVRYPGVGNVSNLIDRTETSLTLVGRTFQARAVAQTVTMNLLVDYVSPSVGFSDISGTADVTVRVSFRNNGNQMNNMPLQVTFYDGNNVQIGTAVLTNVFRGCGLEEYEADVNWNDLPPGIHAFTVKIDSGNTITESSENDNLGSGVVLVDPEQIFLPVITR